MPRILTRGFRYLANLLDLAGTSSLNEVSIAEAFPVLGLDRAHMIAWNKARLFSGSRNINTSNGTTNLSFDLDGDLTGWDTVRQFNPEDIRTPRIVTQIPDRSAVDVWLLDIHVNYPDPSTGAALTSQTFYWTGGFTNAVSAQITSELTRIGTANENPAIPADGNPYYAIPMPSRQWNRTLRWTNVSTGIDNAEITAWWLHMPHGLAPMLPLGQAIG